jgi:hypothetical protein
MPYWPLFPCTARFLACLSFTAFSPTTSPTGTSRPQVTTSLSTVPYDPPYCCKFSAFFPLSHSIVTPFTKSAATFPGLPSHTSPTPSSGAPSSFTSSSQTHASPLSAGLFTAEAP